VNRLAGFLAITPLPLLLWYEAGGDLLIFCYLIALGTALALRSKALAIAPGMQNFKFAAVKANPKCSTQSSTSSTRSTIPKD
jgi:hypothetical protein